MPSTSLINSIKRACFSGVLYVALVGTFLWASAISCLTLALGTISKLKTITRSAHRARLTAAFTRIRIERSEL